MVFFKVVHSSLISAVHQQAPQIPHVDAWIHFAIVCANGIVNVVTVNEPAVELLHTLFYTIGGQVSVMEGGQTVVSRPACKDSRPTLEIYDPATKERKKYVTKIKSVMLLQENI